MLPTRSRTTNCTWQGQNNTGKSALFSLRSFYREKENWKVIKKCIRSDSKRKVWKKSDATKDNKNDINSN